MSRLDVTSCVSNGTLDLHLAGTNYADVNAASTWQDTWLGALNCYLDAGWIDVAVARVQPATARCIRHSGQDAATRFESDFTLANLSSGFPATHITDRQHRSIEFSLHGLDAGLESIRDATNQAASNFSGLVSTDGSNVTIDLQDYLHGWLQGRPNPLPLVATWKAHHAPIASTSLGQILDPRVLPNITATSVVPLREFGVGDTACVDLGIDASFAAWEGLSSPRVEMALFLNGTWLDTLQLNENATSNMTRARLIHGFMSETPGHYLLEARITCMNGDGSVSSIDTEE
jgi:hypothetical protein